MNGRLVGLFKVAVVIGAATLALSSCGESSAPSSPPSGEAPTVPAVDAVTAQRISELVAINEALQAYYQANGQYPVTPDRGSYVSVVTAGEDWIPGLSPSFIASLPRDPAGSTDPNNQYWYASQGGGYKLIVHGVGAACGPEVERDGIRRDPARSREDGSCWAYGYWTDGLEAY